MEYPQRISSLSTEAVGDGLAVLDAERKQSYVLNATSALVFQHCDGQTSPEQLAEILRQKFNLLPTEAERLTQLALEELETARLLVPAAIHPATLSRRQALTAFGALGLSVALLPVVAKPASAQGGHTLVPLLDCVVDNGDGTYTAYFGYLNSGSEVIDLPVGSKNMFVGGDPDRGQPTAFFPGEHTSEFSVVFGALETLKWMLKADGDRRHQVEASATSEACGTEPPTPTPTPEPPTPTPEPPTPTPEPPTPAVTPEPP
ncbi:MAG TPA: PqqD family protein [Thermoanaerobaculia bacterium]|nr:PqqD family protein [Thermoanaerobaculia bacterium]